LACEVHGYGIITHSTKNKRVAGQVLLFGLKSQSIIGHFT